LSVFLVLIIDAFIQFVPGKMWTLKDKALTPSTTTTMAAFYIDDIQVFRDKRTLLAIFLHSTDSHMICLWLVISASNPRGYSVTWRR